MYYNTSMAHSIAMAAVELCDIRQAPKSFTSQAYLVEGVYTRWIHGSVYTEDVYTDLHLYVHIIVNQKLIMDWFYSQKINGV